MLTCNRTATMRSSVVTGQAKASSRTFIVVKSSHHAGAVALSGAIMLAAASPVFAYEGGQGTQSSQYESEMMNIIEARTGKKADFLDVQIKAPVAAPAVVSAPAVVKVEAAMTVEQRTEVIRATAIKEAAASAKAGYTAKNQGASSGPNNGATLLGIITLAAAAGGALYYTNNNPEGTNSNNSSPADAMKSNMAVQEVAEKTPEREGTPAPSA